MAHRGERSAPEAMLPLTPSMFYVLLSLADGDRHGYGIGLEIERQTNGQVKMGPGTLYGLIKRLLSEGLIVETAERPDPELDDERRRYYRLTDFGRRVAVAEAERLEALVNHARARNLLPRPQRSS